MKKTGILTFHKSINYGSVLQAYALLRAIRKTGNSVEVIDYQQKNYDYIYGIFRKPISLDNIKFNVVNAYFSKVLRLRKKNFEEFRKKYLNLSIKKYQHGDDLESLGTVYDYLVCGSDQIWNPNARDFDTNFFLPIPHQAKKISYAVSINGGALEKLENREEIKQNLLDFDEISVREILGKKRLEQFLSGEKSVSVVLDPTLLHGKEEYESICSSRLIEEPYIFFYSVTFSEYAVKAAEILSDRLGLPVYTLYTGRSSAKVVLTRKKIRFCMKTNAPEDFLSLIRHADYVVTNSFHGTAFSIIFQKQFYSIGKTDEDGNLIADERICNILELLGITDRFVSGQELKILPLETCIDYDAANLKRQKLAEKSMEYLTSVLSKQ